MNKVLGTLEALRELNGQFIKLVQDEAKVKLLFLSYFWYKKIYYDILSTVPIYTYYLTCILSSGDPGRISERSRSPVVVYASGCVPSLIHIRRSPLFPLCDFCMLS
jgi:hypothetical protein